MSGSILRDGYKLLNSNSFHEFNSDPPVDVTANLTALIKPIVPQSIEETIKPILLPSPSRFPFRTPPLKVNLLLDNIDFQNLDIISSNLLLDENINTVNIPFSEAVLDFPFNNCGSPEQLFIKEITYKTVKGYEITFSNKFTSQVKISGKLTFKFGEASAERTLSTEILNTRKYTETSEETVKETIQLRVGKDTFTKIKITVQKMEAQRGFNGTILLDGKVVLTYRKKKMKKQIIKTLSEILNENQRTLEISGTYSNIDYQKMPIDVIGSPCS